MESGITVFARDRKGLLHDISGIITKHGVNIVFIQQFILKDEVQIYFELMEVEDLDNLKTDIIKVASVVSVDNYRPFEQIYGKRVIVIGGGAQVAQVVLGAVSEADRHNLRGERISVDTIPLVGETILAEAVRAVGRLHRAAVLVLAGSLMGGEVTKAIKELREDYNIPIISLNMAGSVPKECDLIVSDPVQAGAMAVMHIAETAKFNIKKLQQKKF
jgi:energy-converting hydrogenase B subunit Q|tara:strand:+ start:2634 stop:3284 length:651 start_codon:yes stop_codon:yes gene_type:complete